MIKLNGEIYFCTRLRMLEWLNNQGYRPFSTVPDRRNPKLSTWLFHNSPQLETAVNEYFKVNELKRKRGKEE